MPLRHYFYPGDVGWTQEGQYFSWHKKLNVIEYETVKFYVTDPLGGTTTDIVLDDIIPRQLNRMSTVPDMILMYSHHIADVYREQYNQDVEVRVKTLTSLNQREWQELIDPNVDLAAQPRSLLPATWIIPLKPIS